jgi:hypothetical protein
MSVASVYTGRPVNDQTSRRGRGGPPSQGGRRVSAELYALQVLQRFWELEGQDHQGILTWARQAIEIGEASDGLRQNTDLWLP